MKKLLGLITISLLFFACYQSFDEQKTIDAVNARTVNSTQSDLLDLLGKACVPKGNSVSGCNDSTFIDTVVVNNLPQYPGCSFKVVFKSQECPLGSLLDLTVGDFQILSHDCPQFSQDINDKWNQNIFSDFITNFEISVWDNIESQLISKHVTGEKFKCGEGGLFTINYTRASCYRYACAIQDEFNGLGICTKISCGSQCCERHTFVCRNPDGSLNIRKNDVTNPFAIDCGDPAFLTDPHVPSEFGIQEWTWMTECMLTCPN